MHVNIIPQLFLLVFLFIGIFYWYFLSFDKKPVGNGNIDLILYDVVESRPLLKLHKKTRL